MTTVNPLYFAALRHSYFAMWTFFVHINSAVQNTNTLVPHSSNGTYIMQLCTLNFCKSARPSCEMKKSP